MTSTNIFKTMIRKLKEQKKTIDNLNARLVDETRRRKETEKKLKKKHVTVEPRRNGTDAKKLRNLQKEYNKIVKEKMEEMRENFRGRGRGGRRGF